MPSLDASSSTTSSEIHACASAKRKPAMNDGNALGTISARSLSQTGTRSTRVTSRSFGCTSARPLIV
jgi:hypothetical protein